MGTDLLTTAQAGELLGVTRHRVIALITAGRLQAEKVGMQYLIKPSELEKVRHRKPGRPPSMERGAPTPKRGRRKRGGGSKG